MEVNHKEFVILQLHEKYVSIEFCLNERGRRLWAATEAKALGYGGIMIVSKATGISNKTIDKGLKELADLDNVDRNRIRKSGGGRKSLKDREEGLLKALDSLVEPTSRGDPESPLRWSSKSVRKLEEAMLGKGYIISYRTIGTLLRELDYSLQSNKKIKEGSQHLDRDAQFNYIVPDRKPMEVLNYMT